MQNLCAIDGCENPAHVATCPYCNRRHYHGCVHFGANHPAHADREWFNRASEEWLGVCEHHLDQIESDVAAWRAALESTKA